MHVQQNGIRELPVHDLAGLMQLQTLDVSMNDVGTLPPQLALLPLLQNLTIIGNPIRPIPQSVQQVRPPFLTCSRSGRQTASLVTAHHHPTCFRRPPCYVQGLDLAAILLYS